MEQLLQQALAFVFGLEGPAVYGLVAFFSWAEAAFFLGLVTPGELAIAAGGMLAHRGQVELGWVAAAAAVGTVVGNGTGYWLGRAWGHRVRTWAPFRRTLGRSLDSARDFFRRRGEWAVAVGTFISYVRIFVPFVAGMSGMSFRRFLAFGVPAGIVWAAGWAVLGLLLGESWRVLRETAGAAAFLLLALFVIGLAIRVAAGWVARRQDRVRALARRLRRTPPLPWIRRRFSRQLRWLGRRFDPRVARGLHLTLGFVILLVGVGAAGLVLAQVESVRGIARLDFPALQWMAATRTEAAVAVARAGLRAFTLPGVLATTLVLFLGAWWRWGREAASRAALGVLGSALGAHLLDHYVLHAVVPRSEFPSVPVAVAAALLVHTTAAVGARNSWGRAVATAAVGVFLWSAVALATLVAGWAAPSGIALGLALGLVWSTSVELSSRIGGSEEREAGERPGAKPPGT